MSERRVNNWYCINCSFVLGEVIGSEFHVSKDVSGEFIQTRGPNLKIKCPECGAIKIWYTSDPIVRAIYQLVDAIVSVAASQMVTKVAREIRSLNLDLDKEN